MPDMNMGVAPFSWHVLLTTWHSNPVWDLLMLAALAAYGWGLVVIRRRGTGVLPWYRVASFVAGILVLAVSLNSAIETYSMVLFWVHMVQHLLLIMVVPALLVVGSPLSLLLQATRGHAQERVRTDAAFGPGVPPDASDRWVAHLRRHHRGHAPHVVHAADDAAPVAAPERARALPRRRVCLPAPAARQRADPLATAVPGTDRRPLHRDGTGDGRRHRAAAGGTRALPGVCGDPPHVGADSAG